MIEMQDPETYQLQNGLEMNEESIIGVSALEELAPDEDDDLDTDGEEGKCMEAQNKVSMGVICILASERASEFMTGTGGGGDVGELSGDERFLFLTSGNFFFTMNENSADEVVRNCGATIRKSCFVKRGNDLKMKIDKENDLVEGVTIEEDETCLDVECTENDDCGAITKTNIFENKFGLGKKKVFDQEESEISEKRSALKDEFKSIVEGKLGTQIEEMKTLNEELEEIKSKLKDNKDDAAALAEYDEKKAKLKILKDEMKTESKTLFDDFKSTKKTDFENINSLIEKKEKKEKEVKTLKDSSTNQVKEEYKEKVEELKEKQDEMRKNNEKALEEYKKKLEGQDLSTFEIDEKLEEEKNRLKEELETKLNTTKEEMKKDTEKTEKIWEDKQKEKAEEREEREKETIEKNKENQTDGEKPKPTEGENQTENEKPKPTEGENQTEGEKPKPTEGEKPKPTEGEKPKPTDGENSTNGEKLPQNSTYRYRLSGVSTSTRTGTISYVIDNSGADIIAEADSLGVSTSGHGILEVLGIFVVFISFL